MMSNIVQGEGGVYFREEGLVLQVEASLKWGLKWTCFLSLIVASLVINV